MHTLTTIIALLIVLGIVACAWMRFLLVLARRS